MKTREQWLKENLSKKDFEKALKNAYDRYGCSEYRLNLILEKNTSTFKEALTGAFVWEYTEEGNDYWLKIYKNNGSLNKNKNLLVDFLLYLHEEGLINNYDFDWEKKAKKFLKKNGTEAHI